MDKRERELRRLAKRYGVEVQFGLKYYLLVREDSVLATAAVSGGPHTLKLVKAHLRRAA